jgi:hypothetical protein
MNANVDLDAGLETNAMRIGAKCLTKDRILDFGKGGRGEGGEGGYLEALKANSKLALADGEGVAQVEPPVHVGVGKGHHVLLICTLKEVIKIMLE